MLKLRKQYWSIYIGNALDHFDTAIYSFLAPILAPLFFPTHDPITGLVLAYSVFTTSFLTKPVGAFIFGNMAKNHGPIIPLSYSLTGVAASTVSIGFLPTHDSIGWLAPLGLVVLRILQGIFAAGETTIASMYIIKRQISGEDYKNSAFYETSSIAGIIIASVISTIVIKLECQNAWRVCFILGGSAGFIGYHLRRNHISSQELKISVLRSTELNSATTNRLTLLWQHKIPILKTATAISFSHMTYMIAFVIMNNLMPFISNISLAKMMFMNDILLVFDMFMIPVIGYFSKNINPAHLMRFAIILFLFTIIPLWSGLRDASMWYVIFVKSWIIILGITFLVPLNIWLSRLMNGSQQYMVIGIGKSFGSSLGHLSSFICFLVWDTTNSYLSIAIYISMLTLLTSLIIK